MRFKEYKEGGKTPGDKKTYAYNYLINKGIPAVQAAGIIGNLSAESGLNTTVVGKADNKGSQGIGQWHSERLTGLKRFAGEKWTNLDSQLDYILHELNTTEKRAKNSLFSAKTPQEATIAFMNDYERPAEWAKRQSGKARVNAALQLSGLKPDPTYTYNGGNETAEQNNPYTFREFKPTDYYAPQVSQNVSSLDNTQEITNLAEDKSAEIKNKLDQKKAEKDFLEQMIKATEVAYVNPADFQNQPTFEDIQEEQMFQQGGSIPVSSQGVYDFPNQEVLVPTKEGRITMKNVSYPILGTDEYGNQQMMQPDGEYQFPGKTIHEVPQMFQQGGKSNWYQDAGIFKKQWGTPSDNLYTSLTNTPTSLNEDALAAGVKVGQGIYVGEKEDRTYISPDNILNEVVIAPLKKQNAQASSNIRISNEYQEESRTVRDNTNYKRVDFSNDKNFDTEALDKQLKITDAKRVVVASNKAKTIQTERERQLTEMKGRRNDLDITVEDKKIETKDLLSEGTILEAQQKLKKLGYDLNPQGKFKNNGIDGKLGSITKAAIEQYNNTGNTKKEQYNTYKDKTGFLGKCAEGQCSEYVQNEVFRNYKPNVTRAEWSEQTGLHGDAWNIGKNIVSAGGSEVKTDKVKPGDSVTMYTGGLSSYMEQAKAAGTDATHVGVVDKVNADGSYYILHNVHKLDPLDMIMSKVDPKHKPKYVGMEYRELVQNGKVAGGQKNSGFTVRNAYRPNYGEVKSNPNTATIRKDTALVASKELALEFRGASKVFTETLNDQNNKSIIATKYGISENDYQSIAQATLGIIHQETKFNTSMRTPVKKAAATALKLVGYKKDEVSKGAGQVKYKTNFGETDITEFGITEDNFTEDKNTPLVIMSIVAPYYKKFIKAGETKENALYKSIEKYNRGSNTDYSKDLDVDYVNKVINYGRNFEVQGGDKRRFNTILNSLSSDERMIANNEDRKRREIKNKNK